MKRLILTLILMTVFIPTAQAQADWRWHTPKHLSKNRTKAFNRNRAAEWHKWTHMYIPRCTWYGESGQGPEFARVRYTMSNRSGSGALGKFQFMPGTYYTMSKRDDWTPLDQEISARRLYWSQGTRPWSNC
jgi:hypothetical protein